MGRRAGPGAPPPKPALARRRHSKYYRGRASGSRVAATVAVVTLSLTGPLRAKFWNGTITLHVFA